VTVWAIVVAAGNGTRFGGPKQFAELEGRRVVDWALVASRSVADGVVLVVPADYLDVDAPAADVVVAGGATRSGSVRAGLAAVPAGADVVIVHDAARPFAAPALFEAVVACVRAGADGAVPGVAIADTVKRVAADGRVVGTLDRAQLVAVQTPQAFAASALRPAHAGGGEATDDAALVEAAGGRVMIVPGDPANTKITFRTDLGE
jgi:2-C-methyl-D-erythritol 4-phosphate cytidylyltransferase